VTRQDTQQAKNGGAEGGGWERRETFSGGNLRGLIQVSWIRITNGIPYLFYIIWSIIYCNYFSVTNWNCLTASESRTRICNLCTLL